MRHRGQQQGFEPVYSAASRALILGSYPSPKSFEFGFYYGHPQNRFWPLIAALAGQPVPEDIPAKTALILSSGLALWDSLVRCEIIGASDTSIKNPEPNDIAALLPHTRIEAVFCNGAASHKFYERYCRPSTGIAATCLPSTSPANAAYSMQRLLDAWAPLRDYIC